MLLSSLLLLPLVPSAPLAKAEAAATTPPEAVPVPTALAAPEEVADSMWHGSITGGVTFTEGNSKTRTASGDFEAIRRAEQDRWTLRSWVYFARNDGDVSDYNYGGNGKYDYFVNEKLYYLGLAGARVDHQAMLDLRYYAGGGAGYQFCESETFKLNGEAAVTYFNEEFAGGMNDSYVAARLAYDLDYQCSKTTLFEQTAQAFPSLENSDDFSGNLDTRLRVDMTENMYLQLQHVLDYDNTPAAGAERTDHRFVLGIGWTF